MTITPQEADAVPVSKDEKPTSEEQWQDPAARDQSDRYNAIPAIESPTQPGSKNCDFKGERAFKNFHSNLCKRFGYVHDEKYWWCDQASLEEFLAAKIYPPAEALLPVKREWTQEEKFAALTELEARAAAIRADERTSRAPWELIYHRIAEDSLCELTELKASLTQDVQGGK